MRPLEGVRIVDLSALLPGPLATRFLADAGAEITKIERPGGDDLKRYGPVRDGQGVLWSWLNHGKRIVELDLKAPADAATARELIGEADILVEGFRPGVLARLGLAPATLREHYPNLVLCSITGYGQTGDPAAGHDLNYQARAGLLDRCHSPMVPKALVADIAGGTWPAIANILLALRRAERGGGGCHIDIAMAANMAPFLLWPLAELTVEGATPAADELPLDGGFERYGLYRCEDGEMLAVAALEDVFWERFVATLGLPTTAGRAAVEGVIAGAPLDHWRRVFATVDACVTPLAKVEDAIATGLLTIQADGPRLPLAGALRAPISPTNSDVSGRSVHAVKP